MTLQEDLLSRGYFPEGLPPFFTSAGIAEFLKDEGYKDYITTKGKRFRAAPYSASKRGLTRRVFSVVHPVTAHDSARFVDVNRKHFEAHFAKSKFSQSAPIHQTGTGRAVTISSHAEFEEKRIERLAQYRFIAKTDISRFYHAIYTHSIPWAFHGKAKSKSTTDVDSKTIFFNKLDLITRNGQDAQTIGLPVGPDASRYVAELISTAMDLEFEKRCDVEGYDLVRHVDDIYIGTHSHADAEQALWRYREAMRPFDLYANESKTRIYSADFRFADAWPSNISARLNFALESPPNRKRDRLRAALEDIFSETVKSGDDGVLKYTIRLLDNAKLSTVDWSAVEPFLKRCAVHFGHTIDFVTRMVVWQSFVSFSFEQESWAPIFLETLDRHGRLGNDSEVCWSLYACYMLDIKIEQTIAEHIARNCNALSVVALLNCVEKGLVDKTVFDIAYDRIALENAKGAFWPVMLEWMCNDWSKHQAVKKLLDEQLIEDMGDSGVSIFDEDALPKVFQGLEQNEFQTVKSAIEKSDGYDDESAEDDEEDDGL